ncbi:MAG: ChbG/HpnK family deacetylase, partial [Chloroflexi bacterium]|nr:ChbG/HpnK family deacetylase [Chloroflexota bacterium]
VRGTAQAYEQGIVTSASLMVRWPEAKMAVGYARDHPDLSMGLHIDLGEWQFRDGAWTPIYVVVAPEDAAAVQREVRAQLTKFRELAGKDPDHLDSHQHVHRSEPVASIVRGLSDELGIPLRDRSAQIRYSGDFYGRDAKGGPYPEAITVPSLVDLLGRLPAGLTELGCHPASDLDIDSPYQSERLREVETLCAPAVSLALLQHGIELCSFQDVDDLLQTQPAA